MMDRCALVFTLILCTTCCYVSSSTIISSDAQYVNTEATPFEITTVETLTTSTTEIDNYYTEVNTLNYEPDPLNYCNLNPLSVNELKDQIDNLNCEVLKNNTCYDEMYESLVKNNDTDLDLNGYNLEKLSNITIDFMILLCSPDNTEFKKGITDELNTCIEKNITRTRFLCTTGFSSVEHHAIAEKIKKCLNDTILCNIPPTDKFDLLAEYEKQNANIASSVNPIFLISTLVLCLCAKFIIY